MKNQIKRLIIGGWRTMVPKSARNSMRLWLTFETPDRGPQLITEFDDASVLVLAPHMDDEAIGLGGVIALHGRAGGRVTVVFATNGGAGDPELNRKSLSPQDRADQVGQLVETRKQESRRSAQILGYQDLIFLDGPDGSLTETSENIGALVKIMEERKPTKIYTPALTDNHRDHWATNRILRQAIDRLPPERAKAILIRGYEVWTPLPANRMADITAVVELKRQAIEAFASQTRYVDFSRTTLGLNQYRSMTTLNGQGYAEAFLEATAEEYRQMFDRIILQQPFEAPAKSPVTTSTSVRATPVAAM